VTCLFLIGTAITLFYPVPPPPVTVFPYLFIAYLGIGLVLFSLSRRHTKIPSPDVVAPDAAAEMQ
jgi:hypothetical protein